VVEAARRRHRVGGYRGTVHESEALARWEAVEAILRLKARYLRSIDARDWATLATLFTADALLDAGGRREEGAEAIATGIAAGLEGVVSVHHAYQPEIDVRVDGTATGIWAMDDYLEWPAQSETTGAPVGFRGYGHYHDLYVRDEEGEWRFGRVTLSRIRVDALAGGMPDR
jgi:hypothetical protein